MIIKERNRSKILFGTEINNERQLELDMGRTVVVFLLAFIHCIIECSTDEQLCSGIPYLFDTIIGGPLAAPMFMFCMGACVVYTRKNTTKDFLIRGIQLFVMGFVLNVCRYTVPYAVGYYITHDRETFIEPMLYHTVNNDILQFAGLTFIIIALMKKLRISDVGMVVLGLVASVTGTILNGMDVNSRVGNIVLGYFFGTEDASGEVLSYFVLLNWIIVPILGYVYAKFLKRLIDKTRFYTIVSPICIIITIVYFAVGINYGFGMFGEGQNCYYHIVTPDVLITIAAAIGMFGIYHFLIKILPKKVIYLVKDISSNTTAIYCIHWIFVVFITDVILYAIRGTKILSVAWTLLIACCISIVSIMIAHFYRRIRKKISCYRRNLME